MGRTRRRPGRILLAVLVATLALAACTGGGGGAAGEADGGEDDAAGGADAPARSARTAGPAEADEGSTDAGAVTVAAVAGRQLIRRAHLTLESSDPRATVEAVRAETDRVGGFVSATDLGRDADGLLTGTLTLRVPADELDATMERLTGLDDVAAVPDERVETEDVTGEIADVEARLRNLRAVETELRALLAEVREGTGSADQVLQVFSRIQDVRADIERLEGRRATLGDLVSLATLDVRVTPATGAGPAGAEPAAWSPAAVVRDALRATTAALQAVSTGVIWLGVTAIPVLAVTLGPLLLVAWLLRRRRPRAATADGGVGPAGS